MKGKIKVPFLSNMKKTTKNHMVTYAMVILAFVIMQVMISMGMVSNLIQGILVPVCVYSLAAIGLNLCVGYLGELSLGHAGFMCIGAFSSAFFSKYMEASGMNETVRFILAIIIGTACAAFFGFLIGIPVLRLKGDYLAIVTLAFGEIIKNVINVMYVGKDSAGLHFSMDKESALGLEAGGEVIIGGAKGILGTPSQSTFTVGIILILIALFVVYNLVDSRSGRAIMAIRDNRIAAESVGINITKYKLLGFSISAAIAGAGGVLYAHNLYTLSATPSTFGYTMSILILVYVVLGGIGSFRGSIISTAVLIILPELLRPIADYRMLIYSIVLIGMMLFQWAPKAIEMKQKFMAKFKKNKAKEVQ
jgi:branched-chain amino acid transport system permease protein